MNSSKKNIFFPTELTPENINEINDYKTHNKNDLKDKWKIYLFEIFNGNLKKRLNHMLSLSEYKEFYEALKYEYGYEVEQNLELALSLYTKTSGKNSTNYLSMARMYDIYRNNEEKFNIKKDKNLELLYLFKSFSYCPISIMKGNKSYIKFPLDLRYSVASFLDKNDPEIKNTLSYLDKLMEVSKYKDIISQNDCNIMKGFIEGYFKSWDDYNNGIDLLTALAYDDSFESAYRLIVIYSNQLTEIDKNDKEKKESLISKMYEFYYFLEKNKYYRVFADYGLFLYNILRKFDEALEIFKEGYENNQYECAYYYFHAFTKKDNETIYDINNFNSISFINIFQALIDSFIFGEIYSLNNMFDYLIIMTKKYNLFSQLSNKYMPFLNEIAELCLSFILGDKREENLKKYSPYDTITLKFSAYHALSLIFMYGLTIKVKKNLIKAEKCLKHAMEVNVYSKPYYTRLIYKIRKKLFELGVFEDKNDLINYEHKVLNLYIQYKDHQNYGNSFYYYFGKLYEKGIGTKKNKQIAYSYYQKGCGSLIFLEDNFIIVYKRYLSLKKVNSKDFIEFNSNINNKNNFSILISLTIGTNITLLVNDNMTIGEIKTELYKKKELQNLVIKCFLYQATKLKENKTLEQYKIEKDDRIVIYVEQKNIQSFN